MTGERFKDMRQVLVPAVFYGDQPDFAAGVGGGAIKAGESFAQYAERMMGPDSMAVLSHRNLDFHPGSRQVVIKASEETGESKVVDLVKKEAELLLYFYAHPDELLTYEQILSEVWNLPSSAVLFNKSLGVDVSKLRTKLDPTKKLGLIRTVWGRGYVFPSSDSLGVKFDLPNEDSSFKIDDKTSTLLGKEGQEHLETMEFRLLAYLIDNPGKDLSKSNLYRMVWDSDYDYDSNTLAVQISHLRNKLKKVGVDGKSVIETVRGVGYKFVPEAQLTPLNEN